MLWKFVIKLFLKYNKENPMIALFNIIFITTSVINSYYLPNYYGKLFDIFNKEINAFLMAILYILILNGIILAIGEFEEYYLVLQEHKLEEIIREIRENNKVSPEQNALINEYKETLNLEFLKNEIDDAVKSALFSHSRGELKNIITQFAKDAKKVEAQQDVDDEKEGEVEIDEILDRIGGVEYKERLNRAIKHIEENSNDFLTPEALQTYSPKFLNILENIQDPEYIGLHLVYSQFRTIEGIGIFSLVLDKNGFTQFKIKKSSSGIWSIDIDDVNKGKPTYALYTGTETTEEKEMLRHIYNGEWDQVPESISVELRKIANNNNMGEVIKVFMITSSGSEGINLRNTRYVHIMEPYWHPVRVEQVIGRARRICLPYGFYTSTIGIR